eukprot:356953-Chlamydomonas_euryale.AAC.10
MRAASVLSRNAHNAAGKPRDSEKSWMIPRGTRDALRPAGSPGSLFTSHQGRPTHAVDSVTGYSNVTSFPVSFLYTPEKVSSLYSVLLRSLGSRYTLSTLEPSTR